MTNYADDIPLEIARASHAGTSHVPEVRAAQERDGYAQTLAADYAGLEKYATTAEKRATLAAEFETYRARYRALTIDLLRAKARCMSTMITGGSNFPIRRQQKLGQVADARATRLIEYRQRALAAIRKALTPELQPVMLGDADAGDRLGVKLAKLKAAQDLMVAANATIRRFRTAGTAAQVEALVALGLAPGVAAKLLEPDFCGRIGFADYQLKNNGAEIRRLTKRRAAVATTHAEPASSVAGAWARIDDVPAENRIRVFFSGKPAADVRARLKAAAFRWTPSLGCWQAYRNYRTLELARAVAGVAYLDKPLCAKCGRTLDDEQECRGGCSQPAVQS